MEFTVPGSGPTEQTLLAALQLTGSVLLCLAALGLPWSLLTRLHAAQPWPTLRRSRPLLLTLPALLLALNHKSSVLDSLGQVAQAQQLLTVGEQALLLAYLAAAG
ncbi:MAG: hypothetical protein Q4C67_08710, partial [Deinococcus sp.]|nr:hypothetical protein [Deinococcus sp.]